MKVGMLLPNYARWFRGDEIWEVCEKAKDIGLDSLFFVDHIIVRPHQTIGMGNGYMDIYTIMSYVAAVTMSKLAPRALRLVFGVFLLGVAIRMFII